MTTSTRVTRLAAVAMSVPDPEATSCFLSEGLGFTVSRGDDGTWHVTCPGEYGLPSPSSMLDLHPAAGGEQGAKLEEVCFDVDGDLVLEELRRRLRERGVAEQRDPFRTTAGVRFADPNGVRVWCGTTGPSVDGTLSPAMVRPRRLGHVNLTVADAGLSARFFADVLGLRLSEQIGEAFYFLRVGSEHHNLGIRSGGPVPGAHHLGFEVHGWETYRILCDHLAALGHKVEYGPGRHGPGGNLFVYVRDPSSGLRLELYSDMAHIFDEARYVPPRWELSDRGNTVNRWGPGPPESFLE